MANFPAALDTGVSLPTPAAGNNTNNPSHAGLHAAENAAIIAVEGKVGIGATTPAANQLLFGTGAGTSAWQGLTSAQLAAILSDETGSGAAVFANTPTLITPKVDTINENTAGNGVTVAGINLKSGAITTASSVPAAAIQSGAVGNTQVASGVVVQIVGNETGAVTTGTTTIPNDDTIPQNTEGDQFLSQTITPRSATNILVIEALLNLATTVAGQNMAAALFQDTTANAIACGFTRTNANASLLDNVMVRHVMTAATASATTFKVRAGGNGGGTTTLNGQSGGRMYGGVLMSSITITEYKV